MLPRSQGPPAGEALERVEADAVARGVDGAVVEQPGHQRRLLEADHADLGADDVRRRRPGLGQRRQLDPTLELLRGGLGHLRGQQLDLRRIEVGAGPLHRLGARRRRRRWQRQAAQPLLDVAVRADDGLQLLEVLLRARRVAAGGGQLGALVVPLGGGLRQRPPAELLLDVAERDLGRQLADALEEAVGPRRALGDVDPRHRGALEFAGQLVQLGGALVVAAAGHQRRGAPGLAQHVDVQVHGLVLEAGVGVDLGGAGQLALGEQRVGGVAGLALQLDLGGVGGRAGAGRLAVARLELVRARAGRVAVTARPRRWRRRQVRGAQIVGLGSHAGALVEVDRALPVGRALVQLGGLAQIAALDRDRRGVLGLLGPQVQIERHREVAGVGGHARGLAVAPALDQRVARRGATAAPAQHQHADQQHQDHADHGQPARRGQRAHQVTTRSASLGAIRLRAISTPA
jgi:hypothetical protein